MEAPAVLVCFEKLLCLLSDFHMLLYGCARASFVRIVSAAAWRALWVGSPLDFHNPQQPINHSQIVFYHYAAHRSENELASALRYSLS